MPNVSNGSLRERVDFSKIKTSIPIPNLIEVQKKSYERFLQMDLLPGEREDTGLQSVFNSVFPISDFRGLSQLEFVDYAIGNWECKCGNLKGLHPLRSTCRNPACGATIKTDPFHTGDVLCHHCGTFNKNVVTFCNKCGDPVGLQLKYDMQECQERGMTYAAPLKVTIRLTVYAKDPETQAKSVRDVKEQEVFFGEIPLMTDNGTFIINGTERVVVSQLQRSPGVFYDHDKGKTHSKSVEYDLLPGQRASRDIRHPDSRKVLVKKNRKFTKLAIKKLRDSNVDKLPVEVSELVGKVAAHDVIDETTGEVLLQCNEEVTESKLDELREHNIAQLKVLFIDNLNVGSYLRDTLIADKL